jgi:heme-degrading monooxygenase HmoA
LVDNRASGRHVAQIVRRLPKQRLRRAGSVIPSAAGDALSQPERSLAAPGMALPARDAVLSMRDGVLPDLKEKAMFSVIFEVLPKKERFNDYLELAKHLKPIIEKVDGFIDNERFESRLRPGWLLSHSTWRDEKSVVRWRTEGEHHAVQERGRFEIFADYHLRVGDVTADTSPPANAPIREQRFDETEVGSAKFVTLTEVAAEQGVAFAARPDLLPAHLGLDASTNAVVEHDVFKSIYAPGKLALLVSWRDRDVGLEWKPGKPSSVQYLRHRKVRIVRDYGMRDRREAPQFYPAVERSKA